MPATVRPATLDDVAALTRLRRTMLESMGRPVASSFEAASDEVFRRRLADPGFAAVVACVPGHPEPVAAGVVWLIEALAEAAGATGPRAQIANVVTLPEFRRQGLAQLVMTALLDWCADHGCTRVDLTATGDGQPLYARLGFIPQNGQAMKLVR